MHYIAKEIAINELRSCYDTLGIVAGKHHYDDYWTRDAYFGWLGALQLGDNKIVNKHLTNLSKLQRNSGFIPFMIRQTLAGPSFFGIKKRVKPYPKFKSHKALYTSDVIDSNAYYIIGFHDYLEKTNDLNFIHAHLQSIILAFNWYKEQMDSSFLVKEGFIAQWNDGIYKKGTVLITNIQVYYAAISLIKILNRLDKPATDYEVLANNIKKSIIRTFWNGEYLVDWVHNGKRFEYFDSIANLLAIVWNLVDAKTSEKILAYANKHVLNVPLVKTCFPPYANKHVELVNKIFGVGGYWQGKDVYWIEPSLLMVQALYKCNYSKEAKELFSSIDKLIENNNGIFETYMNSKYGFLPLNSLLYRSENPYARGSGLYISTEVKLIN